MIGKVHKKTTTKDVEGFFSEFAKNYDQVAFQSSPGLQYLDEIDRRFLAANVPTSGSMLDIGVGTGRLSNEIVESEISMTCMDISAEMLEHARKKLGKRARFIQADAGKPFPFPSNSFDVVVCLRVLKYIENWKLTLKEIARVLKNGGIFVFDAANAKSLARFAGSANYFLFDLGELRAALKEDGFEIRREKDGPRLPFPIYKRIRGKAGLAIAKALESLLGTLLPGNLLSRNVYFVCKKVR